MSSRHVPAQRLTEILKLLSRRPCTLSELRQGLYPMPSARQLERDIEKLRQSYPGRLTASVDGKANVWQFAGEAPFNLPTPIPALDEDQITALIAARGMLRLPDPAGTPDERAGMGYHGVLAQAIDRLLGQCGLAEQVKNIAPDAIAISRFGVAGEEDAAFPLVFAAIRAGESLRFTYTNVDGNTHPVHARAIKAVHFAGEWHCMGWAADEREAPGKIKQYRLSRMREVSRTAGAPPGCPRTGLHNEVKSLLRDAFRATGSTKPGHRRRIIVAVSPKAWPFTEGRRWGADQHIDERPQDLPAGWRRLRFVTTGLAECRYWVMGFGAEMRAEHPPELVTWQRDQAEQILAQYVENQSPIQMSPPLHKAKAAKAKTFSSEILASKRVSK